MASEKDFEQLLVHQGFVKSTHLEHARELQASQGGDIGSVLLSLNYLSPEDLQRARALLHPPTPGVLERASHTLDSEAILGGLGSAFSTPVSDSDPTGFLETSSPITSFAPSSPGLFNSDSDPLSFLGETTSDSDPTSGGFLDDLLQHGSSDHTKTAAIVSPYDKETPAPASEAPNGPQHIIAGADSDITVDSETPPPPSQIPDQNEFGFPEHFTQEIETEAFDETYVPEAMMTIPDMASKGQQNSSGLLTGSDATGSSLEELLYIAPDSSFRDGLPTQRVESKFKVEIDEIGFDTNPSLDPATAEIPQDEDDVDEPTEEPNVQINMGLQSTNDFDDFDDFPEQPVASASKTSLIQQTQASPANDKLDFTKIPCQNCRLEQPKDEIICSNCRHLILPPTNEDALIGQVLQDRFQLNGKIGAGGMGMIYHATDLQTLEPLAIKLLPVQLSTDEAIIQRFHREAKIQLSLQHNNIVKTIDYGFEEEIGCYLAMELLLGKDLKELQKEKRQLSVSEVSELFGELCDALELAHGQGIIHRDLKPSNVFLISGDGSFEYKAKLIDFGIAKLTSDEVSELTFTGMFLGTPKYMSPEQASGDKELDHRSDQYSLAIILYELITGNIPFTGETIGEILLAHIYKPPPQLAKACPGIQFPGRLQLLFNKALSKDKTERYDSMRAFKEALQDSLQGVPDRLWIKDETDDNLEEDDATALDQLHYSANELLDRFEIPTILEQLPQMELFEQLAAKLRNPKIVRPSMTNVIMEVLLEEDEQDRLSRNNLPAVGGGGILSSSQHSMDSFSGEYGSYASLTAAGSRPSLTGLPAAGTSSFGSYEEDLPVSTSVVELDLEIDVEPPSQQSLSGIPVATGTGQFPRAGGQSAQGMRGAPRTGQHPRITGTGQFSGVSGSGQYSRATATGQHPRATGTGQFPRVGGQRPQIIDRGTQTKLPPVATATATGSQRSLPAAHGSQRSLQAAHASQRSLKAASASHRNLPELDLSGESESRVNLAGARRPGETSSRPRYMAPQIDAVELAKQQSQADAKRAMSIGVIVMVVLIALIGFLAFYFTRPATKKNNAKPTKRTTFKEAPPKRVPKRVAPEPKREKVLERKTVKRSVKKRKRVRKRRRGARKRRTRKRSSRRR